MDDFLSLVFSCRWSYLIRQRARLWRIGLRSGDWSNPPYTSWRWTVRPPSTWCSEVNNRMTFLRKKNSSAIQSGLEIFPDSEKRTKQNKLKWAHLSTSSSSTTTIRYQAEFSQHRPKRAPYKENEILDDPNLFFHQQPWQSRQSVSNSFICQNVSFSPKTKKKKH